MLKRIFFLILTGLFLTTASFATHTQKTTIGIKDYYPLDYGQVLNYTCDGSLIAEQLQTLTTLTIENYSSIKRVHVTYTGKADDSGVLKIGDKFVIDTYADGIASYCKDFAIDKDYPITLSSKTFDIKAGTRNMFTSECYFNGSVYLKFYFN